MDLLIALADKPESHCHPASLIALILVSLVASISLAVCLGFLTNDEVDCFEEGNSSFGKVLGICFLGYGIPWLYLLVTTCSGTGDNGQLFAASLFVASLVMAILLSLAFQISIVKSILAVILHILGILIVCGTGGLILAYFFIAMGGGDKKK